MIIAVVNPPASLLVRARALTGFVELVSEIVNINPDPPKLTPVVSGTLDEVFWQRACGTVKAKQ
ncbi:MAG: hypothetical protein IPO13_04000 [Rhodocyclaceae bacterium]|nr:hypothetical protein [Rhodocyclaceae bacterium]